MKQPSTKRFAFALCLGIVLLHTRPVFSVDVDTEADLRTHLGNSTTTHITINTPDLQLSNFLNTVSRTKTIEGLDNAGAPGTTLVAADGQRIFTLSPANGPVTIKNLILEGGSTALSADGGAIRISNAPTLYLDNVHFLNHTLASTNNGAAIHANQLVTGSITNSLFDGNVAGDGAIYFGRGFTGDIVNTTFSNNQALATGAGHSNAVHIRGLSFNGSIIDSVFSNNTGASNHGAAMSVELSMNGDISGSIFRDNVSAGNAAGIEVLDSFAGKITGNSQFINNSSNGAGGAVYATAMTGGIEDSHFEGNSGEMGGAVFALMRFAGGITGSTFVDNHATNGGGGAVQSQGLSGTGIAGDISNSTFDGNTATASGGAIRTTKLTGGIIESVFKNNQAGVDGGAIALNSGITGSIVGSTFDTNTADRGGAFFSGGTSGAVTVENSKFLNNTATTSGGAIQTSVRLELKATGGQDTVFAGNTAASVANAIHLTGASSLAVHADTGSAVDMTDSVTAVVDDGYEFTVDKTGDGTWKLGGETDFAAGTGKTTFSVDAGTLHLYGADEAAPAGATLSAISDGSIVLGGDDSSFTMATDTVLSVGGANAITSGGALTLADGVVIRNARAADVSLALAATGGPDVAGELDIDVVEADAALSLSTVFQDSSGTGAVAKIGAGELGLVQADTFAAVGAVDVRAGRLVSTANQSFKKLDSAAGTAVAVTGADLTVAEGTLAGTTTARKFVKTGTGIVDIHGKMTVTDFQVDAGTIGIVVDMGSDEPLVIADTARFGSGTTLAVTGYTGDGRTNKKVVIQTSQAIAAGDMPDFRSVATLNPIGYDFLYGGIFRGEDDKSLIVSSGLTWYHDEANTFSVYDQAHGDFTVHGSEVFPLTAPLEKRTDNCGAWDGNSLRKLGTGTLELLAASSYDGGSHVIEGALVAKTANAIGFGGVDIADGAKMVLDYDGVFANEVTSLNTGILESRGRLLLDDNLANHNGAVHVAAGTLGLSGAGSITGADFQVMDGAMLHGNGSIGNLRVHRGGTVSPGNSIGRILVNGDVSFEAGSFYDVEVDPTNTASADRIDATGRADLGGATVRHVVSGDGSAFTTGEWTILTAANGYGTSRFADEVAGGFVFLDQSLDYRNGTDVVLVIARNSRSLGDFAFTQNQIRTSQALASLQSVGGSLYNDIIALPAGTDMANVYDQLSGELHASVRGMLQTFDRAFGQAMIARAATPVPSLCGFPIWAEAEGFATSGRGGDGIAKARQTGFTGTVGAEKQFAGGWLLGGAFRYGNTDIKVNDRKSKADVDSFLFGLYGGRDVSLGGGTLRWGLGASYGFHDIDTRRNIAVPGMSQSLEADYHGHTAQAVTDLGYAFALSCWSLEPFVQAMWNSSWSNRFSESGGNAALRGEREHQGNFSHTAGLRARVELSDRVSLRAGAGWLHTYGPTRARSRYTFDQGGDRFTIRGICVPKDAAQVNLGVGFRLTPRTELRVDYDGLFGSKVSSHSGSLTFQYTF